MSEVLRLSGVYKAYGGIVVADNVNLSIDAGEVLGLIGPNGAGKTSLFNLISGVVRPDAGRIMLQGTPIDSLPLYRRARAGIARTWQNMLLFNSMSVMENLLIAPRLYPGEAVLRLAFGRAELRRAETAMRARGQEILARMELTHASTSPANAAPSAASLLRATSACSANSDLKNAARSMRLGRLAAKFWHCIAQRLVDDRALVARQALLQSRHPSADRLQRWLHGFCRDDA